MPTAPRHPRSYFEWMPVRPSVAGTTYRRLRFGKLADLSLLDLRSFRSQQEVRLAQVRPVGVRLADHLATGGQFGDDQPGRLRLAPRVPPRTPG
jgi:phosphodiesterase/alkaline phosphatase D-like protein